MNPLPKEDYSHMEIKEMVLGIYPGKIVYNLKQLYPYLYAISVLTATPILHMKGGQSKHGRK